MMNIRTKFGYIYSIWFLTVLVNIVSCERYEVHKAMRNVNHTHQRKFSAAILPEEKPPYSIIFVFGTFGLAVFVRCIWSILRIKPPYIIVLFGVGCVIGWLSFINDDVHKYVKGICDMSPKYLLMIFLPVIIFRAAYGIDAHLFVKCIKQILLFSTVGCIISLCLMAVVMKCLYFSKWSWEVAIMFGAITSTCYAEYTVSLLRDLGLSKYLSIIIEGEGLIADASAIVIFNIVFGYVTGYITEGLQIFAVCIAFLAGSPFVGFLLGKLTVFFLTWSSSDPIACATITLVSTYLSFYIAEQLLGLSGVLCIVMLGMVISIERLSIRTEMDNFLEKFWELLAFYASSLIFMMVGVLVFEIISAKISFQDTMMSFVVYAISFICRAMMYTFMNVTLKWCKYNLTWRHATVAMWGNLRGAVSLCLALVVHKSEGLEEEGPQFLIYTAVLVLLTHIIQGSTLYPVMKLLGLHEISEARIANMNSAMKYIYITRERALNMVKMDRHLADANWLCVADGTKIKHPYKIEMKDLNSETDVFLGIRFAFCPDCEKEVLAEPSKKEFKEMQREAYLRILKAKKISYRHQFEQGMLTKEGIHILVTAVDIASHRKVPIMEVNDLKVFRKRRKITLRIRKYLIKMLWRVHNVQPPKRKFNLQCYKIVMRRWFEYCLCGLILLQVIPISLELHYSPDPHSDMFLALMITQHIFYIIFLAEFIMKIAAFGWKMYFKDAFNSLDFSVLIISTVCLFFYYQELYEFLFSHNSKHQSIFIPFAITFCALRLLRLVRILRISLPQSIIIIDTLLDYHIMLNYDVGKGFVAGEEDVLKILPHIIDNKKIYTEIRQRIERDRLTVSKDLGMIQKEFPEIAITVKTRQSIRVVLNKVEEAVTELKNRGIFDEFEYSKCKHMINMCLKYLRTHFKKVEPCPPHILLKEISWISGDSKVEEFLFERCQPINFNYDDVIISHSTLPEALYIILYGVVKIIYEPTSECVWDLQNFGALPNVDYFTTLNFEEKQEEYIVGGNVIGELGILTGRPYDVTVQCETSVQAFKVSMNDMLKAMELNPDPGVGLKARMWKSVAVRIANVILSNTPQYQSWPQEEIKYHLERAFVPTLSQEETFSINDLIEDVILIEGQVMDTNSRNIYYAPCCIPRTVQKLYFPGCNAMKVLTHIETKLLIVPMKHYNEVGVHGDGQNIHIAHSFSTRCLQHSIKNTSGKNLYKDQGKRSKTILRHASKMSTKKSVDFSENNEVTQYIVYPNEESISNSDHEPSSELLTDSEGSTSKSLLSRFDLQGSSTMTATGSRGNIPRMDDSDVSVKKEQDAKKSKNGKASEPAEKERSSQKGRTAGEKMENGVVSSKEESVKLSDITEKEEDEKDENDN